MSITRHHAEWLSLLDVSGPFLSLAMLARVFPQGLNAPDAELGRELRVAYEEWLDNSLGLSRDPAIHQAWIEWVIRRVLDMPDAVLQRQNAGDGTWPTVKVAEHGEELQPNFVIGEPGAKARVLVQLVPAGQDLEKALAKAHWQASPATRMMTLLRGTGVHLGIVTNGEQWMLVNRPADENITTGFISWYARLWLDEPLTLRAFRTLLDAHRLFGVPDKDTIEVLLLESANDQQEVTDQLGYQVRRAVELLVQAIDLADQNEGRALLAGVREETLYEAALTVMMRLVFLLFAEEQNLLLLGDDIYDRYYAVSTLLGVLREEADRAGEEVLERRYDAWARLLAIFRAVYGGFGHDRLSMPAYGGSLFDPDRYPFLEGRPAKTVWTETPADPLPVSNRTVLHLLESLQVLRMKVRDGSPTEARRVSFRALDIEQIGHVYEGLLDHTVVRAKEPVVGLAGTRDKEPEIALAELEREQQRGDAAFLAYLQETTGRSGSALKKAYGMPLDAFRATLLRAACGNDEALYTRVVPFAGLIRDDDYGRPVVIPAGSVYMTAGAERRATGTHYTPKSLTEPIVQHTLEPLVYHGPAEGLPREEWKLHSAADLLKLTVCDMAMGSGAFLVQACRYLSERLMEAWAAAEGPDEDNRRLITSDAFPTINPDEAIPANADDRLVFARRLVADRCLYGVDKNPLAVEMAKLSLWLITLAKGQPFGFLDHALKCGDSLLGISSIEQLTHWSLDLGKNGMGTQATLITRQVEDALEVALHERRKIATTRVRDARDAQLKAGWLATADAAMALVKLGADLLIAAALHPTPKMRQSLLTDWLPRYSLLLATAEDIRAGKLTIGGQKPGQEAYADLRREADELLRGRKPFHWPLEFPEVIEGEHGFTAIVGNPPFVGGRRIRETLGNEYRDVLYELYLGSSGNADLCAFFFLRSFRSLRSNGAVGLIATNTIAQGDTRQTGLDTILNERGIIYKADNNRNWPGSAAVTITTVHIAKGFTEQRNFLDGQQVSFISSLLNASKPKGLPYELRSNENQSFQGTVVVGSGFVLDEVEKSTLLIENTKNNEVIQPYLNGEDLNTNSKQLPSRWIINFFDLPLEMAQKYNGPMKIVRDRVYPMRMGVNREAHRKYWWHYGDKRPALYKKISSNSRVLTCAQVSKHLAFVFVPKNYVYDQKLVLFIFEDYEHFAALQSNVHGEWAWYYSSTMRNAGISYSPTDVFRTFPMPDIDFYQSQLLSNTGSNYHLNRQRIMLIRNEGLTKIYNRFHDQYETSADIAELRRLHVEMDNAVAAAYGWSDLDLGHGFYETKQGKRYTISEAARREVLDRLLQLNHERYAEEVAAGVHEKGAKKATASTKKAKTPAPNRVEAPQLTLDLGEVESISAKDFDQVGKIPTESPREIVHSYQGEGARLHTTSTVSPLDKSVIVMAMAIIKHQQYDFDKTFGHVKAEKTLHLIEAHCDIDLGRTPARLPAGPADFAHLLSVAKRGKELNSFQDVRRTGDHKAYQFVPLPGLSTMAARMEEAFGAQAAQIEELVTRLVGLSTDEAEVVATLYAAWNDLLADGEHVTEEKLFDTFYAWNKGKRKYPVGALRTWKTWMEGWGIVPTGKAKRTQRLNRA